MTRICGRERGFSVRPCPDSAQLPPGSLARHWEHLPACVRVCVCVFVNLFVCVSDECGFRNVRRSLE